MGLPRTVAAGGPCTALFEEGAGLGRLGLPGCLGRHPVQQLQFPAQQPLTQAFEVDPEVPEDVIGPIASKFDRKPCRSKV